MPNPGPERLRRLALDALEEVVSEAGLRPVRRTWAVRFSLAYLSSLGAAKRWRSGNPHREFWRAMGIEGTAMRARTLGAALGTIYAWADEKRDPDRAAAFATRAEEIPREGP
jgi:hypothetical protein